MSNVVAFGRPIIKSAASKARVGAMAKTAVLLMNKAQRDQERAEDVARLRKMIMDELELSMCKAFAVLGKVDAEFAISLAFESAKRK